MFSTNRKPTEPICFILFKRICSLFLITALIWYLLIQFLEFYESVSRPILTFKNEHLLSVNGTHLTNNIIIEFCHINRLNINCKSYAYNEYNENFKRGEKCTIITSEITDDYCAKYEFEHKGVDLLWIDIGIKSSDRPIKTLDSKTDLDIFYSVNASEFGMLSIYLAGLKTDKKTYNSSYMENSFFLSNGQVAIIDYLPIMKKYMVGTYAYGLAGGERESYIEFDAHMNILPLMSSPPNTIKFGIRPKSFVIQRQEEAYHQSKYQFHKKIDSIISNVGGFFSTLSGIFVFLFGASKIAPWGLMQKNILSCIPCQRSFLRNFAKKYISTAGIPLVEKVSEMPVNAILEDRVQMIENLLKEYYIDTEFLELLKKEKLKYKPENGQSTENGKPNENDIEKADEIL